LLGFRLSCVLFSDLLIALGKKMKGPFKTGTYSSLVLIKIKGEVACVSRGCHVSEGVRAVVLCTRMCALGLGFNGDGWDGGG
jgi:hypothetical protein